MGRRGGQPSNPLQVTVWRTNEEAECPIGADMVADYLHSGWQLGHTGLP